MVKILIVDDDPISVKICCHHLEPHFRVYIAHDVESAKKIVQKENISVVLSDFWLKEFSIDELLEWRNQHAISVPVIGMSKYSEQVKMKQAIEKGLFDFLAKPVDKARLVECVQLALSLDNKKWTLPVLNLKIAEKAASNPAILNAATLLSIFGPDARLMNELIKAFLTELELKRSQFEVLLLKADFKDLHRDIVMLTHRLESSACYIGAEELALACREIESCIVRGESIQHGDLRHLLDSIAKLNKQLTNILDSKSILPLG